MSRIAALPLAARPDKKIYLLTDESSQLCLPRLEPEVALSWPSGTAVDEAERVSRIVPSSSQPDDMKNHESLAQGCRTIGFQIHVV